jgi:hypothetical protein
MKLTYEPDTGRGYVDISDSNIDPDQRYAVRTTSVGVSAKGLVELGQWITKVGRDIIREEKREAKEATASSPTTTEE